MGRWATCKRRDFIRKLRDLGFEGPFSGARHAFMIRGRHRLTIPSNKEYSVPQLRMMLGQVEQISGHKLTAKDWRLLG